MKLTSEQRQRLKDKLLELENEELFNVLKLDMDTIFNNAIDAKTDQELLDLIIEDYL